MTDLPPSPTPDTARPAPAKRPISLYLSAAALAVSVIALGMTATLGAGGSEAAFGKRVRAYLIENPQVLDEVVQAREEQADTVRVGSINEAIKANPDLLKADPRDPAFGPADAKVTVIEFFDFRCPGCKAVAPEYRALIKAHPEVRFVFKDWPILDRGDDHTSQYAARAALAAHQQGKYLAVYDGLMGERSFDQAGVDRILTEAGVDLAKAKLAMVTPEMTRHVTDIHTVAATLGLQGTPSFIVNGQAASSIDPAEIDKMIKAAK